MQGTQTEPTWSPYKFKVKYRQHFRVSSKIKNDSKAKSQLTYPIGASLIAPLVKNPPAMQENPVRFLVREDPLEKNRLPTPVFLGFPCGSAGKESACSAADLGSIPGLGRSPGEGKGYPLRYSGLKNFMNCTVHGVASSQT